MRNNIIKSVLKIVGCENLLRPNELEMTSTKTIAELLDEKKESGQEPEENKKEHTEQ